MNWLVLVPLVLLAIGLLTLVAGYLLPGHHRVSRTRRYSTSPEQLFGVLADVQHYAEWRSHMKAVEVLPDDGRGLLFRERGGHRKVVYRFEVIDPPRQLISRVADPSLPYDGEWVYDLKRTGTNGTELTITEDSEIKSPFFRVMQKLFFSPYETIDTYLNDLGRFLNPSSRHS